MGVQTLTIDEVMKCIKDEGISQVDLKTTDIWEDGGM